MPPMRDRALVGLSRQKIRLTASGQNHQAAKSPWRCKQSHSPAKLEAVGRHDQAGWNLVFSVSIGWWKVFRNDSDCMTRDS